MTTIGDLLVQGLRRTAPAAPVKERPILFSAPMVKALLAGTKTQTRRLMKPQPEHLQRYEHGRTLYDGTYRRWCWKHTVGADHCDGITQQLRHACPYGVAGDRLWVRETWAPVERTDDSVDGIRFAADEAFVPIADTKAAADAWVAAANNDHSGRWRPSIHMPRWASRITLEVTGVRVQRLQDITEEDAKAEGVSPVATGAGAASIGATPAVRHSHVVGFRELWCRINGNESWESSPWVWCVSFRRVTP